MIADQVSLKEKIEYKHGKKYGYVDMGVDLQTGKPFVGESPEKTNHALVFMVVDLKGRVKATAGYFLINTLTGQEHANLVEIALITLHEHGVNIHSFTYDGDRVNIAMVHALGANTRLDSLQQKLFFPHPVTGHRIFLFPDPCHMLKNVRNAFADAGPFYDTESRKIDWAHILALARIQENEKVYAAKITPRHTNVKENKMKVRLAAQILSNSVREALLLLDTSGQVTNESLQGTAEFCGIFNDAFDILNCR